MEPEVKAAIDTRNKDLAEELLNKLKLREEKLKILDQEIREEIGDGTKLETELEDVAKYEDIISTWTTRLQRVAFGRRGPSFGSSHDNSSASANAGVTLRLPKFDMPKFNGDMLKWPTFWSAFKTAVHEKEGLENIDKFNYLRSVLTDTAFRCIEGLTVTEDNYSVAVERLEKRFGKTEQIIDGIMTSFAKLTSPKTDAVSLRQFFDETELKILNLKALEVDINACKDILRPMIVKLLPDDIQMGWVRHSKTVAKHNLDTLIEFIRTEVELRESIQSSNTLSNNKREIGGTKEGKNRASTSALSVVTDNKREANSKDKRCMICDDPHLTMSCKVKTLNERLDRIKRANRCFNCLWRGHDSRACRRDRARCGHCKGSHHSALCAKTYQEETKNESNNNETLPKVSTNHVVHATKRTERKSILLQAAIALVEGEQNQVKTRIIIDGGSQRSFISRKLVRAIGAKQVGSERMIVNSFTQKSETQRNYPEYKIRLFDKSGVNCVEVIVCEVESACSTYSLVPSEWIEEEMTKRGLELAETSAAVSDTTKGNDEIHLLIGSDYFWSIMTGKVEKLKDNLAAMESIFGWVLQGHDTSNHVGVNCVNTMHICAFDMKPEQYCEGELLNKEMENFWKLENLGIDNSIQQEDTINEVEQRFYETIVRTEERYRVRLPWNERKNELMPNFNEALRRFHIMVRRLIKNDEQIKRYHEVMLEYLRDDHAEEVKDCGFFEEGSYYIPHQAVFRETHDTMKLRVVFDASSGTPSLNDCLHAGPHMNPDVLDLLLRFRRHIVAITADMEKAFLQVEIDQVDRDAARFIWLPKEWKIGDLIIPKTYRMKRVFFGLNCGPFLLAATIKFHLRTEKDADPNIVNFLENNIYVDDLAKSVPEVSQGVLLYKEGKRITKNAGFNLRKWATNSEELRDTIIETEFLENDGDDFAAKTQEQIIKVLGLSWNQWEDCFIFETSELCAFLEGKEMTKRIVLQAMARIFDPLGLLAPFTIRLKCMFQRLWKEKVPWDKPAKDQEQWKQWVQELTSVSKLTIPRCISAFNINSVNYRELHLFSDASEQLYGAVAYFLERSEDETSCRLIASKNKVAPMKNTTIPRLELLAALIAVRLSDTIQRAFGEKLKVNYWTDSMVALQWIKGNPNRWKQFVANRVREIQEKSSMSDWQYVQTKQNPADKVTKAQKLQFLLTNSVWLNGPDWLTSKHTEFQEPITVQTEVRKEEKKSQAVNVVATEETRLWNCKRFSKWTKLIRMIAWLKRFLFNCRAPKKQCGDLTVSEIAEAERTLIITEQQVIFAEEYEALRKGEFLRKSSKIRRLDPSLDGLGLMRLGGRLHFSMLDNTTKHPIILSGESWTVQLLIQKCHETVLHGGVAETLVEIREKYWIISARSTVKKVLRRCLICIRRRAKPAEEKEGHLPEERVEISHPFEVVGIDYAGPIYVSVGKSDQCKTYVLLITCAVTRAVHLELVPSMTVDDFLLAFRRFVARRGLCRVIWSDNAKTFKRAEKDLRIMQKITASKEVAMYIQEQKIEWKYIVDRAPWWGGMWERLVRTVKNKLKIVCGRAMLKYDELRTILVEVEGIVNSRPLSYVSEDPMEILTPAHFLIGRRTTVVPPATKAAEQLGGDKDIGKRWKFRLTLLNRFWKAWKQDYLLMLRTAHERRLPRNTTQVKEGQAVLLDDEKTARHLWKVCLVDTVIPGRDGVVRSCIVKLPGNKKVRRPIQLLYPLELEQ